MNYFIQRRNYLEQKFVTTLASALAATLKLKFTAILMQKFVATPGLDSSCFGFSFQPLDSIVAWRISQLGASLHLLFPKNLIPYVDRIPNANFYRPLLTSNTKPF